MHAARRRRFVCHSLDIGIMHACSSSIRITGMRTRFNCFSVCSHFPYSFSNRHFLLFCIRFLQFRYFQYIDAALDGTHALFRLKRGVTKAQSDAVVVRLVRSPLTGNSPRHSHAKFVKANRHDRRYWLMIRPLL